MTNATEDYNTFVRANLPSGMTYSNFRYWVYGKPFVSYKQAKWYLDYTTKMIYLNPILNLDFTTGVLPAGVTFTRAGGGGRINSSGLYEWVGADVPRFDYDPVTLKCKGLLIEESRTNYFTHSGDAASAWTTLNNVTVSPDTEIAPDGALSADAIVENTATTSHYAQKTITLAANQFLTWEISLKPEGSPRKVWLWLYANSFADAVRAKFDLVTGEVESVDVAGTGASVSAAIKAYPDGFFRVRLTGVPTTAAVTDLNLRLRLDNAGTTYTGDGISGVHTWGSQLEAGAFPTSYIPTTTTPATRAADACVMTGADFSRWFNPSEGTIVVDVLAGALPVGSNFNIANLSGAGSYKPESLTMFSGGTSGVFAVVSSSTVQAYLIGGVLTPYAENRMAAAYAVDDYALSLNGAVAATDTAGTLPSGLGRMVIGSGVGSSISAFDGHIRRILYYPRRLDNSRIQELAVVS